MKSSYINKILERTNDIPDIKAIIVNREGTNIINYITNSEPLPINSITKTIVAILLGIAIKKGIIASEYEEVNLLEYNKFKNYECSKSEIFKNLKNNKINIKELLTMSSGIDLDEKIIFKNEDWLDYLIKRGVNPEKKGSFNYKGISSHLLGILISEKSGISLAKFANEYLFKPMDIFFDIDNLETKTIEYELSSNRWISSRAWDVDINGNNLGSFSLRLRAEDLSKIATMMLNCGEWNGKEIVSKNYIRNMISKHVKAPGYGYYGYQGWYKKIRKLDVFSGMGIHNQYMTIAPKKRLSITILSKSIRRISKGNEDSIEKIYIEILKNELCN